MQRLEQRLEHLLRRVEETDLGLSQSRQSMSKEKDALEDIIRANMVAGLGQDNDLWIVTTGPQNSPARFAISKHQAAACSEYFRAAMKWHDEVHLQDVDTSTTRILRLCLCLGPSSIDSLRSSSVYMELSTILSSIRLAHRLLMPWMASALSQIFETHFCEKTAIRPESVQVKGRSEDDDLCIAFQALTLARQIQDVSSKDEGEWGQAIAHLSFARTSTVHRYIAQNIADASLAEWRSVPAEDLSEILRLTDDDALSDWETWAVPHGQSVPEIWTSRSDVVDLDLSRSGFIMEIHNLQDPDLDLGAFVKVDVHGSKTALPFGGLYRLQIVAIPIGCSLLSMHSSLGRSGSTPVVLTGGWGWDDLLRCDQRHRYVHIDQASGKHYKIAFRAGFLKLHKQVLGIMRYFQATTEDSYTGADLLALSFECSRAMPGRQGETFRDVLIDFASRAFEATILQNPLAFSSLTSEEIADVLGRVQALGCRKAPLCKMMALWIHSVYKAHENLNSGTQQRVDRSRERHEGLVQKKHTIAKAMLEGVPDANTPGTDPSGFKPTNSTEDFKKTPFFKTKPPAPLSIDIMLKAESDSLNYSIDAGLVVARATC